MNARPLNFSKPSARLNRYAIDAVSSSKRSRERALERFISGILSDPSPDVLILEMIGDDQFRRLALDYIDPLLPPDTRTGSAAAPAAEVIGLVKPGADKSGSHVASSDPSAPLSAGPTPAPAGGDQRLSGSNAPRTSVPPDPVAKTVDVTGHKRGLPLRRPNPPAVSRKIHGEVARLSAEAVLGWIMCGNVPLLNMTAGDALDWAARQETTSRNLIATHERLINTEVRYAKHYAAQVPPTMTIRDFYDENPDLLAVRRAAIAATLEEV